MGPLMIMAIVGLGLGLTVGVACGPCSTTEAEGVGECDEGLGWGIDICGCYQVRGCSCEGADCDALFDSLEACEDSGEDRGCRCR